MGDSTDLEKAGLAIITGGASYAADEAFFAGGRRAARSERRAVRREEEARRVSQAQQENERRESLRQQMREERVRRAQIISEAEASGVGGSSASTTTIGSGQTLAAAGQAFSAGVFLGNQNRSGLLQSAQDFRAEGREALAQQQMFRSAFDLGMTAVSMGAGGK